MSFTPEPLVGYEPNGFIDRAGNFYRCGYEQHRFFAPGLFAALYPELPLPDDADQLLRNNGWAAISKGRLLYEPSVAHWLANNRQADGRLYRMENHPHDTLSAEQVAVVLAWHEEDAEDPNEFSYNLKTYTVAEFLEYVKPDPRYEPIALTPPA